MPPTETNGRRPKHRLLPQSVEQAREHPARHDDHDAEQGTENEVRKWIHACSIRHERPVPLIRLQARHVPRPVLELAPESVGTGIDLAPARSEIIQNG